MQLFNGDCLQVMQSIPDQSVEAIITDPPYGTTACKWDSVIPFEPMWEQLKRIIKPKGAIVLFAIQPFTSALVMSNPKMFKYCWVWEKERPSNFFQAKYAPLNQHEDVTVFSHAGCNNGSKTPMSYIPQGLVSIDEIRGNSNTGGSVGVGKGWEKFNGKRYKATKKNYPKTHLKYSVERKGHHPTQKPVALIEYLIKTYTQENETVLDFTMGSGTTGVAAKNTNRQFIGIEQDKAYFDIAEQRIASCPE